MGSVADPVRIPQVNALPLVAPETYSQGGLASVCNQRPADAMQTASEPADHRPQTASPSAEADQSRFRRRASKLGLLSLFNRSKGAIDAETVEENLESQWQGIVSGEGAPSNPRQAASVPAESDLEANQMTVDSSLRSQSSKGALRNKSSFKKESKVSVTWTPPPLFQAYPQAIKHAALPTPLIPAETILRHKKERNGRGNSHEESSHTAFWEAATDDKGDHREKKPKKSTTEVGSQSAWVDKIYILVTAGYLLQYAGTGAFDRSPEKILPLSPCSAAFASDAIIGKHFVLQISQVSSVNGTIDTDLSRSILKKSGLRSESKKAASSFLLVLENGDEMNEWLVVVRREIESLNGLEDKHKSDTAPDEEEYDPPSNLQRVPSQQYLVRGDPHRSSEKVVEPLLDLDFGDLSIDKAKDGDGEPEPEPELSSVDGKSSIAPRSTDSRYISNTHASIDQVHLDRLRESYASTAEGTTSTSRDSSPDRALSRTQTETGPDPRRKASEAHLSVPEASPGLIQEFSYIYSANRDSLQPTPTSASRPTSVLPASPNKSTSPPNFSVPTFSKRFSAASASASASTKTQTPPPGSSSGQLSPAADRLAGEGAAENSGRYSTVGELHLNPNSNSSMAKRFSSPHSASRLSTPPTSSHSHKSWTDAERQFSRRLSSLEYARGISPIKMTSHTPPPHPPPNVPLPPIPSAGNISNRNSLIPPPTAPPTGPLPPLPDFSGPSMSSTAPLSNLPTPPPSGQRPASTSSDVALPLQKPSPPISSVASPTQGPPHLSLPLSPSPIPSDSGAPSSQSRPPSSAASAKSQVDRPRGLRRPGSSQQQPGYSSGPDPVDPNVHHVRHQFTLDQQVVSMGLTSSSSGTEPPSRPTREAPIPPCEPAPPAQPRPPTPPKLHKRNRSTPRLGREPPPVSSPRRLSKSKPSNPSSRSSSLRKCSQENARPSFIPPIQVSSRKSRGSFDGPWNTGYEGPTKTVVDLGAR